MDLGRFFRETTLGFIVKNLLAAVIVGCLLIAGALVFLQHYTRHGQETLVPDLRALSVEDANVLASQSGLSVVIVDTAYSYRVPLGAVLEQSPAAESHTKAGRPIYVVVNAKQMRLVPLPSLTSVSYRQAEATLHTIGLGVASVEYEPSIYNNLVLDVRYQGNSVEPGTRLKEGTQVVLIVGIGGEDGEVMVPNLVGMTVNEARAAILSQKLIPGGMFYDVEPEGNEAAYRIYSQSPAAGSIIDSGSRVDMMLTTDENRISAANEDEFFE